MIKLVCFSIIALAVCLAYSNFSIAVCVQGPPTTFTCNTNPPNPDLDGIREDINPDDLIVNVLPGAGVDTTAVGGDAIRTGNGMDIVDVDGGDIDSDEDGIDTSTNQDQVTVKDSTITAGEDGIDTSTNKDTVTVINSTITAVEEGIDTSTNMDIVTVTDSTVKSSTKEAIETSTNIDQVTIINSIIMAPTDAIQLGTNDDTITLGTGADIRGLINCDQDSGDTSLLDTIIFAMDVPEEALPFISSQIAAATVPDGSVTINGLFYEWINCNILENQLNGVRNVRPIPTLSEWGLIAMAGALGVFGTIYMARRRQTA